MKQDTAFGYDFANDHSWSVVVLDTVPSCCMDQTGMFGSGEGPSPLKTASPPFQQVNISELLYLNLEVPTLSITAGRIQTEVESRVSCC